MSKLALTKGAEAAPEDGAEPKPAMKGKAAKVKPDGKVLELGASPRANLLPPEIHMVARQKATQRALWIGVVGVVLVVIVAYIGAAVLNLSSTVGLVQSQDRAAALVVEQGTHSEVRDIKTNVALSEAALEVGASTEVDLKTYLLTLGATLPAGVAIMTVETDGATPIADYPQSDTPLEGPRVGTLVFTAISPTIPSIPVWLDGLATLDGFVDAVPNSVTLNDDGTYLVTMTMHIDAGAYSNRFAAEEEGE
jgi:hypothetical protein